MADTAHRANAPGNPLVIERPAQADLTPVDGHIKNSAGKVPGLSPHAFIACVGDFTNGRTAQGNDGSTLNHDSLRHLHAEPLAHAQIFALGGELLQQSQGHGSAGAQNRGARNGRSNQCRRWRRRRRNRGLGPLEKAGASKSPPAKVALIIIFPVFDPSPAPNHFTTKRFFTRSQRVVYFRSLMLGCGPPHAVYFG